MKKLGLKARYPKRFKVTTDSDHNDAIAYLGIPFAGVKTTWCGEMVFVHG
jgi:hypothetical protein